MSIGFPLPLRILLTKLRISFHLDRIEIGRLSLSCLMHYFICTDAIKGYLPSSRFRPELVEDDRVISHFETHHIQVERFGNLELQDVNLLFHSLSDHKKNGMGFYA